MDTSFRELNDSPDMKDAQNDLDTKTAIAYLAKLATISRTGIESNLEERIRISPITNALAILQMVLAIHPELLALKISVGALAETQLLEPPL